MKTQIDAQIAAIKEELKLIQAELDEAVSPERLQEIVKIIEQKTEQIKALLIKKESL